MSTSRKSAEILRTRMLEPWNGDQRFSQRWIVSAAESDNPDLRYFAPEHLLPLVKEAENAR